MAQRDGGRNITDRMVCAHLVHLVALRLHAAAAVEAFAKIPKTGKKEKEKANVLNSGAAFIIAAIH